MKKLIFIILLFVCSISFGQVITQNRYITHPAVQSGFTDLYAQGDAADANNETDSVGADWYDDGGNGEVFESVAGGYNSSYALHIESNGANYGRWGIVITGLDNTKTYRFSYDAKSNNAANTAVGSGFIWVGDETPSISDVSPTLHDTWESISFDTSPVATSIKILLYPTDGVEAGEDLYIDNFTIEEL